MNLEQKVWPVYTLWDFSALKSFKSKKLAEMQTLPVSVYKQFLTVVACCRSWKLTPRRPMRGSTDNNKMDFNPYPAKVENMVS